jgi:hypothetical protein
VNRCRLQQTVYAFETDTTLKKKVLVETGLDWEVGEKIGIAATNMRTMDFDECTIAAYDSGTGWITCENELEGFHFGGSVSTFNDYGVDMRAEVMYYGRNIKITASQEIGAIIKEAWGCRVLVADFFEASGTKRKGSLNLDNVQVHNCSQK